MRTAAQLRTEYGLRFDSAIPPELRAKIDEAQRRERDAAEIAELLLLPPAERFAALADREWNAMRVIWRFGYLANFRRIVKRAGPAYAADPTVMTSERHLWRETRDLTVPHLIAWQAFRDAHRKMSAVEKEAA